MLLLNEALDDLGKLRVRNDALNVEFRLSTTEARACVEAFIYLMGAMVVPDIFAEAIDTKFLVALPDIIDSPYVNIEPGVRVMYYNALYYGLQHIHGPGDTLTNQAYLKVLEGVPAWLDASTNTVLDGQTAALTAWTAINNHDYQLSWKFHCKSCQFLKLKGIDQLDVRPAQTWEEEDKRDSYRFLYWHILSTDTLFRLFYKKPTVVSACRYHFRAGLPRTPPQRLVLGLVHLQYHCRRHAACADSRIDALVTKQGQTASRYACKSYASIKTSNDNGRCMGSLHTLNGGDD